MKGILTWLDESFVPLVAVASVAAVALVWTQVRTHRRATRELVIPVRAALSSATAYEALRQPRWLDLDVPSPASTARGAVARLSKRWLNATRQTPEVPGVWANLAAAHLSRGEIVAARAVKWRLTEQLLGTRHPVADFDALQGIFFPNTTPQRRADRDGLFALLFNLGLAHQRLGEEKAAVAAFESAAALQPKHWQASVILGSLRLDVGDLDGARRRFEAALANAPDCVSASAAVGEAWHRAGQPVEASRVLRLCLESAPEASEVELSLAQVLQHSGDPQGAEVLYGNVVSRAPADPAANYYYGTLLEQTERLARAAEYYRRAVLFHPSHAAARRALGKLYLRSNKLADAGAQFAWLHDHDPKRPEHAFLLAKVRSRQGQLAAASRLLQEAIDKQSAAYPAAWLALGSVHKNAGRPEQAARAYLKAARLAANVPDVGKAAYRRLGRLYASLGKHTQAVRAYKHALTSKSADAGLWLDLAKSYRHLGRHREAIAAYRSVIIAEPDNARALSRLGSLLAVAGKDDEAIDLYHRALRIAPTRARTWLDLGAAQRRLLNTPGALEAYKKAIAVAHHEDDKRVRTSAYRTIALLHQHRLEYDDALEAYRQVTLHFPDDAAARYGMAEVLYKLGNHSEARAEVAKLLAVDPSHRKGKRLAIELDGDGLSSNKVTRVQSHRADAAASSRGTANLGL